MDLCPPIVSRVSSTVFLYGEPDMDGYMPKWWTRVDGEISRWMKIGQKGYLAALSSLSAMTPFLWKNYTG